MNDEKESKNHKHSHRKHTIILVTANIILIFLLIMSIYFIIQYYDAPSRTHTSYTIQKGGEH